MTADTYAKREREREHREDGVTRKRRAKQSRARGCPLNTKVSVLATASPVAASSLVNEGETNKKKNGSAESPSTKSRIGMPFIDGCGEAK